MSENRKHESYERRETRLCGPEVMRGEFGGELKEAFRLTHSNVAIVQSESDEEHFISVAFFVENIGVYYPMDAETAETLADKLRIAAGELRKIQSGG